MAYSSNWDEATPPGTEARSLGDDRIRELKIQLRERLATEHSAINGGSGSDLLMHKWGVVSKSANYTATLDDHVILVTTVNTDRTITLPNATTCNGKPYKIKKVDSGTGKVIIDGYSTQTIDGAQTLNIIPQYGFVDIISDGSNWIIISTNCNFDWDSIWSDAVHTHQSDAEGGVLSGQIVQIVNTQTGAVATGTTTIPIDDTIPQNTEGDQYLSLSITPKNTNNILVINIVINLANDNSTTYWLVAALFQDTTANALAVANVGKTGSYENNVAKTIKFSYYMIAGTTSSTTFKVRGGSSAGTTTFNGSGGARMFGGVFLSSITITEYGTVS